MLEVADIFRACGPTWRRTVALSLGQLKGNKKKVASRSTKSYFDLVAFINFTAI